MKIHLLSIFLFLFVFRGTAQVITPQVISSSGDVFYTSFGSVSFTTGEPMIETISNAGSIITQGFHQPWLNPHNSSPELISENAIVIYPNPANTYCNVLIKEFTSLSGEITMRDALGRVVFHTKIDKPEIKIQTTFPTGVYLVEVNLSGHMNFQKLIINSQD